jgi:gliding motility-associated lipoprotein GldH
MNRYLSFYLFSVVGFSLLFSRCSVDERIVLNQFEKVDVGGWHWNQGKKFTFTITDTTHYYELSCGLRITGSYSYSNIWLMYKLDGPSIAQKNQFEVVLSDNTGKWLGSGQSNLISYDQPFAKGLSLKAGTYTLELAQNMRDERLKAVSDVGLKVIKAAKIY